MSEGTIALTIMSGLLGISFLGFLFWGIFSGQFKDIEEAKYQLFRKQNGDEESPATEQRDTTEKGGGRT